MMGLTHASAAVGGAVTGPAGADIRDIAPPVPIPSVWDWWPWLAIVLACGAAMAALVWWWRRRSRESAIPVPVEPAHVRARRRLESALGLVDQPKPFCVEVSDALRWYLEERFELRAPERTTEEFLGELRATDCLLPRQKEFLSDFLRRCDLVKFARYEPAREELLELHAAALRLVEDTAPTGAMAAAVGGRNGAGDAQDGRAPAGRGERSEP